jgi:hypothetical protein
MNTQPTEHRCTSGGVACREVVERVRAAELARYVFGCDDEADRLLATAQRWAVVHNYGNEQPVDVEPETVKS